MDNKMRLYAPTFPEVLHGLPQSVGYPGVYGVRSEESATVQIVVRWKRHVKVLAFDRPYRKKNVSYCHVI